ncbi:hypothetical protein D3C81_2134340 [compost metagenome]
MHRSELMLERRQNSLGIRIAGYPFGSHLDAFDHPQQLRLALGQVKLHFFDLLDLSHKPRHQFIALELARHRVR